MWIENAIDYVIIPATAIVCGLIVFAVGCLSIDRYTGLGRKDPEESGKKCEAEREA